MRKYIALLAFFCSLNAWSMTCTVKVTKANCWENYNVIIDMHISSNPSMKRTASLVKKTAKDMAVFEETISMPCKRGDRLVYESKFNPPIWDSDKGSSRHPSSERLGVSMDLPPNTKEYKLDVCFPRDFADVPYPMEYTTKCKCPERPKPKKKKKR